MGATGAILLVCAANVCRSPMAALTLERAFAGLPGFESVEVAAVGVSVGGTMAICPMVEAFHEGDEWRLAARAHRSRQLDREDALAASLVLTASRGIRSSVVAAVPEVRSRVFTMREALWLGADAEHGRGVEGPEAVVAFQQRIDGRRGLHQRPKASRGWLGRRRPSDPLDIADGHQLRGAGHLRAVRAVDTTSRALAALIAGQRAAGG